MLWFQKHYSSANETRDGMPLEEANRNPMTQFDDTTMKENVAF